jgi:hypothetical protein
MVDLFVAVGARGNIMHPGNAATRNAAADEGQPGPRTGEESTAKLGTFRRWFGFPQHTPVKIV